MAIRRDNENLSATPFPKELRALLDASPVYDMDNVYLSEEGWIYRHYKSANKSRWWDEILFSGEVDTTDADNAPVSATVSAGVKLGSADYTPTLETGDNTPGFGYGDTIVDTGVPAPITPDTVIDEVSVSGEAAPTIGDTETYTAVASGTVSSYSYVWLVTGGTIDSGQGTTNIDVTWTASGAGTVECVTGSTDGNWDGTTQNDSITVTVAAAPTTTIGGVNIDEPFTLTVGIPSMFIGSIGGDATVTWQWSKVSGPGTATFTAPTFFETGITVDTAGDYVFKAEASSTDAGLVGGSPNSKNTAIIPALPPTPPSVSLTLTGAEPGNTAYQTDAGNNAALTVTVGGSVHITNNPGGHPVDIVQSDGGPQVTEGTLVNGPAGNGQGLTWDTEGVTPGDYYYQCTSHPAMIGTITVVAA